MSKRAQLGIIFFLCVSGFLIVASGLRRHFGFPLDDSWIHQTVARNLVQTHVLGFLPGVHSSGSSSLLWTLVLTTNYLFFKMVDPIIFCLVLGALLIGATGVLLKRNADLDGVSTYEAWILGLAPVLSGNFLWLGTTGMEHLLFVTLSLGAFTAWFVGSGKHRRLSLIATALLLALLALTRPEGVVLIGVLILFRTRANRSWLDCSFLLLAGAVAEAISIRINWVSSHTLLPLTMKGRQWLYFGGHPISFQNRAGLEARIISRTLSTWTIGQVFTQHIPHSLLGLAGVCCLVGVAALMIFYFKERRYRTSASLLWMLVLNVVYVIILPSPGQGSRYQPFQLLFIIPLAAIGATRLVRWWFRSREDKRTSTMVDFRVRTVVLAALAVSTFVSIHKWRMVLSEGIDQINVEHGAMATWVLQNIPADDISKRQLAVFDIGRIGYSINGSLVDLGGLTDADYLPYLFRGDVSLFLKQHRVQYIILPGSQEHPEQYVGKLIPEYRKFLTLESLKTFCAPEVEATQVMMMTGAAAPCQTAYLIHYI